MYRAGRKCDQLVTDSEEDANNVTMYLEPRQRQTLIYIAHNPLKVCSDKWITSHVNSLLNIACRALQCLYPLQLRMDWGQNHGTEVCRAFI